MRLDDLALKVLIEEVRDAHGPEAQRVVHALFAQAVEVLAEIQQLLQMSRGLKEVGSGGSRISSGLMNLHWRMHVARVAVVGLGIAARVPGDLAPHGVMVVVDREMPAVAHHGAAALVGDDLQPERGSSRARMISGRSRLHTYEQFE